jgi:hypothetical protein
VSTVLDCLEVFAKVGEDAHRVRRIDSGAPHCACESQQVSQYQETPVEPDEYLVRIVFDPTHITKENGGTRLNSATFSDAKSFGSSCIRRGISDSEEYKRTIEAILKNSPTASDGTARTVHGVIIVPVSEIRKMTYEIKDNHSTAQHQAFAAYATGESDRPAHAEIMVALGNMSNSKADRLAINFSKSMNNNFVDTTEFLDFDLSPYVRK